MAEATKGLDGCTYVDYGSVISAKTKRIAKPVLRELAVHQMDGSNIRMGGGFPNPSTFPLAELQFKLKDGTVLQVDPTTLAAGLQYGLAEGMKDLTGWLLNFQQLVHSPPTLKNAGHPGRLKVILTHGAIEAIFLTFMTILDEGDWALSEDFTYPTGTDALSLAGAKFHGIKTDEQGMVPEDLDRVLASWDSLHPGTKKPRLMYVMTSCANPTGVTWTVERKRAAYQLARKHDLIIVEDDAYYFLQFARPPVQSLLSMDEDGRVIRIDTFSKIISSGIRVAWMTGPAPLLEAVLVRKDSTSLHPSGVAQGLLIQLLKHWGPEKLLSQTEAAMQFYKNKAEMVVKYLKMYLTGLAEWNSPSGGLFFWIRVLGVKDSKIIYRKALARKVVTVYGGFFNVAQEPCPYLRVCYSLVSEDECQRALKLLAEVIREVKDSGMVD